MSGLAGWMSKRKFWRMGPAKGRRIMFWLLRMTVSIRIYLDRYKPIGAAPWGHFLWRGEGAFGQKRL